MGYNMTRQQIMYDVGDTLMVLDAPLSSELFLENLISKILKFDL